MPFFSIIIPVYNVERYLKRCIESVLGQSRQDFQLILYNDGSMDNSLQICNAYAREDTRIRVVDALNEGSFMARCNALQYISGEYILFMDADDYWERELLQSVFDVIEKTQSDIVMFRYQCVNEKYETLYSQRCLLPNETVITDVAKFLITKLATTFEYNSIILKVIKSTTISYDFDYKQFKSLTMGDDAVLTLLLALNCKRMVYMDKILYNYRMNPSSITHKLTYKNLQDFILVREEVNRALKRHFKEEDPIFAQHNSFIMRGFLGNMIDLASGMQGKKDWYLYYDKMKETKLFRDSKTLRSMKSKLYLIILSIRCFSIYRFLSVIKKILKYMYNKWVK